MLHLGFSRDFTRKITTSVERLYPKSAVLRTDDVIGCRNVTTYMVCNHVDVIGYYACTNAHTHTHLCIAVYHGTGIVSLLFLRPRTVDGKGHNLTIRLPRSIVPAFEDHCSHQIFFVL